MNMGIFDSIKEAFSREDTYKAYRESACAEYEPNSKPREYSRREAPFSSCDDVLEAPCEV
jgi:hypothetical protein